jgi:aminomethyltransferase
LLESASKVEPVTEPRRPFLYDDHVALGAKMVPFGGWDMPLQYEGGTVSEHLRCREEAVVFDVSHLGTVRMEGPEAFDLLQRTLTNDLRKIAPGRAQYTHLCNDQGGVTDDIIVWWVRDEVFDVMPNASNTSGFLSVIPGVDVTAERCVLAVQGPRARALVGTIDARLAEVPHFGVREIDLDGITVRVAGTGYTGEDGIEIAVPNVGASRLLRRLVEAGISPAGLGARDTLRLEAALPLHGHELSPSITTLEARLGWVVGWKKESFIGAEALRQQRSEGPSRLLTGVVTSTRQPLREGATLVRNGVDVGVLTSGNFSPVLERGIGLGFVDGGAAVGETLVAVQRGREIPVTVCDLPFVRKAG